MHRDDEGSNLAADVEVGVDCADAGTGSDTSENGNANAMRGEKTDYDRGNAQD